LDGLKPLYALAAACSTLDDGDCIELRPHPVVAQMSVMLVDHLGRRSGHSGDLEAVDFTSDHFADRRVTKRVHHDRGGNQPFLVSVRFHFRERNLAKRSFELTIC
jgi:hypothetical protein